MPNRYSVAVETSDALVKSGEGVLHSVSFSGTTATATAGTILILDEATDAGTGVLKTVYVPASYLVPFSLILDVPFFKGLYVDFDTAANVEVTLSYR